MGEDDKTHLSPELGVLLLELGRPPGGGLLLLSPQVPGPLGRVIVLPSPLIIRDILNNSSVYSVAVN